MSQGSAPTSRRKRLGPTPGTVLPGNHEVAQRDYGATMNYTKRAFSRQAPLAPDRKPGEGRSEAGMMASVTGFLSLEREALTR